MSDFFNRPRPEAPAQRDLESLQRELHRLLDDLGAHQTPPPPERVSSWKMLTRLWKVVSPDCRAALIGEFIFNPEQMRARYEEELQFQRNIKDGWK